MVCPNLLLHSSSRLRWDWQGLDTGMGSAGLGAEELALAALVQLAGQDVIGDRVLIAGCIYFSLSSHHSLLHLLLWMACF